MTALPDSPELAPEETPVRRVHRVEVRPAPHEPDPLAHAALDDARRLLSGGVTLRTGRVYLIDAALDDAQLVRIAHELLADPVSQRAHVGAADVNPGEAVLEVHYQPGVMDPVAQSTREAIVEMTPDLSIDAVQVRTGVRYDIAGLPGDAEDADTQEKLRRFAAAHLANPVIQDIHTRPFWPGEFPRAHAYQFRLAHVAMRDLDDAGLVKMSREAHLFLSLDEMRAIRDYYIAAGREPTDVELETLAQTWSEHCVHKTLKSTVTYREGAVSPRPSAVGHQSEIDWRSRPGHTVNADGSVTIHNLLKSTIAAATKKLIAERPHIADWCVSVFVDNAGVVKFDETDAVCIKVETHNHPSAIEPYGGAATGIGGCIRDVMGTGLSARPIANTDVFAVAWDGQGQGAGGKVLAEKEPGSTTGESSNQKSEIRNQESPPAPLPKGVIHPKRVLQQVVAGVRDYGNRMGIPTVNGAVYFHEDYLANPLVFAGCVGTLPLDKCFGEAKPGDHIIALGGRTGRDGIHGATFSSAELTDTHADEFAHAVQIGNAITQKKTMDVILQARDPKNEDGSATAPLYHAITDCGAGGFSSAVGEMGAKIGAAVKIENAPLKYEGLSYTEVWISEAQERMVLAVPPGNVEKIRLLCEAENVEMCDLGTFGYANDKGEAELLLTYHGQEVGRLSMHLLHEGIPTPTREAKWNGDYSGPSPKGGGQGGGTPGLASDSLNARSVDGGTLTPTLSQGERGQIADLLRALLAHPNIASKHWIIRQYDHEVQGGSVVKPLVGPMQDGPSDASVLRPKLGSTRGIAIGCGLQTGLGEKTPGGDSYWMALAAIDEAVRNVVCVGADPTHIAILDNFCWPRCDDPRQLGSLVRAAEACYDGALAYGTPFVSGKDSLSNQFTTEDGRLITIPPTLLITAMAIVPDVLRARTMDAKAPGHALLVVGQTTSALGGSHYLALSGDGSRNASIPRVDLATSPRTAQAVAALIAQGLVASAHDCSDGGLLIAAAEMAFAGRVGLDLDLAGLPTDRELDDLTACFAETPGRYLLEIEPGHLDAVVRALREANVPFGQIGAFAHHQDLTVRCGPHGRLLEQPLDALRQAWLAPLDW